jgi:hypothetical protein
MNIDLCARWMDRSRAPEQYALRQEALLSSLLDVPRIHCHICTESRSTNTVLQLTRRCCPNLEHAFPSCFYHLKVCGADSVAESMRAASGPKFPWQCQWLALRSAIIERASPCTCASRCYLLRFVGMWRRTDTKMERPPFTVSLIVYLGRSPRRVKRGGGWQ